MPSSPIHASVVASLLAVTASAWSVPLTSTERGKTEYQNQCASCHGTSTQGDGPLRPYLLKPPADLSTLAQRHGGRFPQQQVRETIDGRGLQEPGPHGTREMPVWGQRFRLEAQQTHAGRYQPERRARQRIDALVDYLRSQQQ
jgi:mono/diheme cytochrome c family protein